MLAALSKASASASRGACKNAGERRISHRGRVPPLEGEGNTRENVRDVLS
jgi:hypothetical protein